MEPKDVITIVLSTSSLLIAVISAWRASTFSNSSKTAAERSERAAQAAENNSNSMKEIAESIKARYEYLKKERERAALQVGIFPGNNIILKNTGKRTLYHVTVTSDTMRLEGQTYTEILARDGERLISFTPVTGRTVHTSYHLDRERSGNSFENNHEVPILPEL